MSGGSGLSGKSLKILVAGDVDGNFKQLFDRVTAVNKKAGPFSMLFCVGSFFPPTFDESLDIPEAPVPTYILGPVSNQQLAYFPDLNGTEVAPNITYLGRQGVYNESSGLKIAYLSGIQQETGKAKEEYNFNHEDVRNLHIRLENEVGFRGVDIFLTTQWPAGVQEHAPPPEDLPSQSSALLSPLTKRLKPRYHFAGIEGIHYERAPFRNHEVLAQSAQHCSRFIALGKVGNSKQRQWIYEFNIVPIAHISREELIQEPANVTANPFLSHGPCWFCLASPEMEKHLIISIGESVYLTIAKGGLTPDHLLIVPIGHFQSTIECPPEVSTEVIKFKQQLTKYYESQGKAVVYFERNFKSPHLQIQVVPIPKSSLNGLKLACLDFAESEGIEIQEFPPNSELYQMTKPGFPYFFLELPDKSKLFVAIKKNFPIQFGRELLASKAILNCPDKVDWKQCKMSKDEEVDCVKSLREGFKPYDFSPSTVTAKPVSSQVVPQTPVSQTEKSSQPTRAKIKPDKNAYSNRLRLFFLDYTKTTCSKNRKCVMKMLLSNLSAPGIRDVQNITSKLKKRKKWCTDPTTDYPGNDENECDELPEYENLVNWSAAVPEQILIGYIKEVLVNCREAELRAVASSYTSHARTILLHPERVVSRQPSVPTLPGWMAKWTEDDVIAVDCEMISKKVGLKPNGKPKCDQLAATVSVVNFKGESIYSQVVKHAPADVYLTDQAQKITGFTKYSFVNGTELSTVQAELRELFQRKLIVFINAGSDFKALKMKKGDFMVKETNTNVFDLHEYYTQNGEAIGLRRLIMYYYKIDIQKGVHDAETDARFTMKLFREKYIPDKLANPLEIMQRDTAKSFDEIPKL